MNEMVAVLLVLYVTADFIVISPYNVITQIKSEYLSGMIFYQQFSHYIIYVHVHYQ